MRRTSRLAAVGLVASVGLGAGSAAGAPRPQLSEFEAQGRIASGKVARYDLREESTAFRYRIRAERVQVGVFRRRGGGWRRIGVVKARPPHPLNFWRVFRKMGVGRYRLVARAVNGSGRQLEKSRAKTIRFRVVDHVPHVD